MAESQSELNRLHHQRLKEQGFTRAQLWLHRDDMDALKSLATLHRMSLSRLVGILLHNPRTIEQLQKEARAHAIPLEALM